VNRKGGIIVRMKRGLKKIDAVCCALVATDERYEEGRVAHIYFFV